MNSNKIICIVGPTAAGKTRLSVDLALHYNTEIISADSVQVYRGLDIGSAKPTRSERKGVPHHMIDCIDLDDRSFSVCAYKEIAFPIAKQLISNGKIPIIVGGSGLYISAFTNVLSFAVPCDRKIRYDLEVLYDNDPTILYNELRMIDPITYNRLHINDKKRIVRALEVYRITGKPFSTLSTDFQKGENSEAPFVPIMIGLTMERDLLYKKIDQRVDEMINNGLIEEARNIYDLNCDRSLPGMQSIGYKQLFSYFDGECTLNDSIQMIKRDTRHFAKRQTTWFKRDIRINWIDCSSLSYDDVLNSVYKIIDEFREGEK